MTILSLSKHPSGVPSQSAVGADSLFRVIRDDGSFDPNTDPRLADAKLVELYQSIARNRIIDERLLLLQRQGRISFHVGSVGEEAAIVGSAAATRPQDWLFPCYREIGALLYRGFPLQKYIDNMFGNANDTVKGRQMPDHYTSRELHYGSVTSVIGTQITHAVGVAWAAKIRKEDVVSLSYFGDGATSSNDFHSGMNFAGVFRVPTVFICRNNGWAISVPASKQSASETFASKAAAYGIPAIRCDGNDIVAVFAATRRAIERAVCGEGPTMIEMVTYRLAAHTTSDDPKVYRKESEVEEWRARDPIVRMRAALERKDLWSEDHEQRFFDHVMTEYSECVRQAELAPTPPIDSLFDDVYAEMPWNLRDQRASLRALRDQ